MYGAAGSLGPFRASLVSLAVSSATPSIGHSPFMTQLTGTNKSPDTDASQKPPTVGCYLLTSGRCVAIRVPGQRLLDAASAPTLKPPPKSQAQALSPAAPAQEAAPASCTQAHRAAHAVSLQQSILIRVSTRPPSVARTVVQADPSSEQMPGKDTGTSSAHHHSDTVLRAAGLWAAVHHRPPDPLECPRRGRCA